MTNEDQNLGDKRVATSPIHKESQVQPLNLAPPLFPPRTVVPDYIKDILVSEANHYEKLRRIIEKRISTQELPTFGQEAAIKKYPDLTADKALPGADIHVAEIRKLYITIEKEKYVAKTTAKQAELKKLGSKENIDKLTEQFAHKAKTVQGDYILFGPFLMKK
jgi:hypothetical protein